MLQVLPPNRIAGKLEVWDGYLETIENDLYNSTNILTFSCDKRRESIYFTSQSYNFIHENVSQRPCNHLVKAFLVIILSGGFRRGHGPRPCAFDNPEGAPRLR